MSEIRSDIAIFLNLATWFSKCIYFRVIKHRHHVVEMGRISVTETVLNHYIDVIMSAMASKSPAYRLFVQPFVQAHIKENIKAKRHSSLWGESTGDRWFPLSKGQWCFHLMTSSWRCKTNFSGPIGGKIVRVTRWWPGCTCSRLG